MELLLVYLGVCGLLAGVGGYVFTKSGANLRDSTDTASEMAIVCLFWFPFLIIGVGTALGVAIAKLSD